MLAYHPTTGKPIRILRTEAPIAYEERTLVWVRPTFVPSPRWSARWNAVATDLAALQHTSTWTAVILHDDDMSTVGAATDWRTALPQVCLDARGDPTETLVIASEATLSALQQRGFVPANALAIEDLCGMYPYLAPVDVSSSKESLVVAVAHILRMHRIVWHTDAEAEARGLAAWTAACKGTCVDVPADASDRCIPRLWLIQQYYVPSALRRAKEIQACLIKNVECDWVDHILLLNEEDCALPVTSDKIQVVLHPRRLTYAAVLQTIRARVPPGDFVAFSNSDIFFDKTLRALWHIGLAERRLCLALLRWEYNGEEHAPTVFGPRADSQDSWIVARDCVVAALPSSADEEFDFPFGKPGCDNAVAMLFLKYKFLVCNPAYTVRSYHMHASEIRNYDAKDILYKPMYLYSDPTAVQPLAVKTDLSDAVVRAWSTEATLPAAFPRVWLGVREEDVARLCASLQSDWGYCAGERNLWTPPPDQRPLYRIRADGGVFANLAGLVWTARTCLLGNHAQWKQAWDACSMHMLQSCMHVPSLVSVPCSSACTKDLATWVLDYLPAALQVRDFVRKLGGGERVPEFLVPHVDAIGAFLEDCVWNGEVGNITVSPMLEDMTYFADVVWSLPPEDAVSATASQISQESIARLRALLPEPTTAATPADGLIAVICLEKGADTDSEICNRKFATDCASLIFPAGWTVRIVSHTDLPAVRRRAFQGATWIVGSGNSLDWMWYAPVGATVLEFMDTAAPVGNHAHLAGACSLRYIACAYHGATVLEQRQNALVDVGLAIQKHGFFELLTALRRRSDVEKPVVYLPAGAALSGIWAHTGDSFREMVRMWADRGYITLRETEASPHCWWGEIGDVLLYDRDTPRWWATQPAYQLALFGNPAPPGPGAHRLRQSEWCYWPRHPAILEDVLSKGAAMRGYGGRTIPSLFLGKVENGVQLQNRTRHDWSKAVDLFSMPIDPTGKPYPYSQEEYLEKLCSARFGLCLPGFGQKCHREIEYFACGCVPIVTDGVDMTHFLVPPIEGIHYLRASTPEQVRKIVTETSRMKWAAMSIAGREWWRAYASAEGLFRLTFARIEQCRPYLISGIPPDLRF